MTNYNAPIPYNSAIPYNGQQVAPGQSGISRLLNIARQIKLNQGFLVDKKREDAIKHQEEELAINMLLNAFLNQF